MSGQFVPRSDGGTDVLVRVVNWFIYLLFGFLIALIGTVSIFSTINGIGVLSATETLKGVASGAWLTICGVGLYWAEVAFVKKIFKRVYSEAAAPV